VSVAHFRLKELETGLGRGSGGSTFEIRAVERAEEPELAPAGSETSHLSAPVCRRALIRDSRRDRDPRRQANRS
jgi:hypothetical protein